MLDEFWLDLTEWLPFLPGSISNGWVPFAAVLLVLIGYYDLLKAAFGATNCESRQSVFTLLLAAFLTLTLIGVFFRGEGMALILPWS